MNESLYAAGYLSLRHTFGMNESLYADWLPFMSRHIFGMNESLYAAGYLSLRHIFGMNESLYAAGYLSLRHIFAYE